MNYPTRNGPRVFSSFTRLGSFIGHYNENFNPIELSEAGLINVAENLSEISHFGDVRIKIEDLENSSCGQNLGDILEKELPFNRMVRGFTNENVPLHETINNIPFSEHRFSNNS